MNGALVTPTPDRVEFASHGLLNKFPILPVDQFIRNGCIIDDSNDEGKEEYG